MIGQRFADTLGLGQLATSSGGFDGQYYYFMARFPGQMPAGAFDNVAERYSRPLYPLVVRLLSFGQTALIPWMMLAVNVAAICAAAAIVARLLRERGLPTRPALVVGLYCGQALATQRDLTDPLSVLWIAIALFGLQRRRFVLAGAAMGLGLLTRESTIPFVACFAAPLVVERDWRGLGRYLALALVPYVTWSTLIRIVTGHWGLEGTAKVNGFVPLPFLGLTAAPTAALLVLMLVFACVPAVTAIVLGAFALTRRPWHDAFLLAAALAAMVYGLAVLLEPSAMWLDIWGPMRMVSPLAVLLPFLAPPPPGKRIWTLTLGLMSASFLLALGA